MSDKIFNKRIEPKCEYCVYGIPLDYDNEILCRKRGITENDDYCRRFKYDPLKREPRKEKISDNYNPEDFIL